MLRRQVLEYVSYTSRHPLVEKFTPERSEELLYSHITDYLQRENLQKFPKSQRSLMTLVLRKLLASSSFAIAGALSTLIVRLNSRVAPKKGGASLYEQIEEDYEASDEWGEDAKDEAPLSDADRAALEQEIRDLTAFRDLAISITDNAKGRALLSGIASTLGHSARITTSAPFGRRIETDLPNSIRNSSFGSISRFSGSMIQVQFVGGRTPPPMAGTPFRRITDPASDDRSMK